MSSIAVNAITDAAGGNTATINSYTPTESNMAGRNRIINGDMKIDQRNAGASVTPGSGSYIYTLDRWSAYRDTTFGAFSVQQSSTAPTGFSKSVLITVTTASTPSSGQAYGFRQAIEGFNFEDFGWGTASAQNATVSFWTRSSLTGTFGGAVFSNSSSDFYPFTFAIGAANTWEYKTVTIPGRTSGTFAGGNGNALNLWFSIGMGTTYTPNEWNTSGIGATGATNIIATSGATFYLTGVQLEAGSVATPFERRQYGQELALCQRYYYSMPGMTNYPAFHYNFSAYTNVILPVTMRTTPTVTANGIGSTYYEAGTLRTFTVAGFAGISTQSVSLQVNVSGGTSGFAGTFYPVFQASAEL